MIKWGCRSCSLTPVIFSRFFFLLVLDFRACFILFLCVLYLASAVCCLFFFVLEYMKENDVCVYVPL